MMHWIYSALAALLPAAAGLLCGGVLGQKCVRWLRISSFEGGSGYAVIGMALLGAAAGFVTGLVCTLARNSDGAAGYDSTAGIALLWVLGLTGAALALCRLCAQVPPRLNGALLMLEIEMQLPAGLAAAAEKPGTLRLYAVSGRTARHSWEGQWFPQQAREEDGRIVVPGAVPLETDRGRRMIGVQWNGEDFTGYLVPLPGRPGREFLTWSAWGPRPQPPLPAWPETQPRYRFRIQPRTA